MIRAGVTNLAGGEDVLPVPGESHGADWGPVVGLEEGGHAPVGDAVPDLDAAVGGAADEVFAGVVPPEEIFWLLALVIVDYDVATSAL